MAPFSGPIIGAILVNAGKSFFTGALPEYWLFALGGLFIVVTLFMPKGIVGLWAQLRGSRRKTTDDPERQRAAAKAGVDVKPSPEPAE